MTPVPVERIVGAELPVPTAWRAILKSIADHFVTGAPLLEPTVRPFASRTSEINAGNVAAYPAKLTSLSDTSWESSIYAWQGDCWHVLIDLTDENGSVTDLVLHVSVFEATNGFEYKPGLIYVP